LAEKDRDALRSVLGAAANFEVASSPQLLALA
jgi:hypothetical protein